VASGNIRADVWQSHLTTYPINQMSRQPVQSVPADLVHIGYHWEKVREHYFANVGDVVRANHASQLAALYASRLSVEHGLEVA
jgi:hypothetical protein